VSFSSASSHWQQQQQQLEIKQNYYYYTWWRVENHLLSTKGSFWFLRGDDSSSGSSLWSPNSCPLWSLVGVVAWMVLAPPILLHHLCSSSINYLKASPDSSVKGWSFLSATLLLSKKKRTPSNSTPLSLSLRANPVYYYSRISLSLSLSLSRSLMRESKTSLPFKNQSHSFICNSTIQESILHSNLQYTHVSEKPTKDQFGSPKHPSTHPPKTNWVCLTHTWYDDV